MLAKTGRKYNYMVYTFHDGDFSFHVATSAQGLNQVFRVPLKEYPESAASRRNIPFVFLRDAQKDEVDNWLDAKGNPPVVTVRELYDH